MHFFLSAETIAPAASKWVTTNQIIEPQMKQLQDNYYGPGLNSIAIISIILPEEYFDEGGYKERRLYKRKSEEADIRLRLDYHSFLRASDVQRLRLYSQHIIASIATLNGKMDRSFSFEKLIEDVKSVLAAYL